MRKAENPCAGIVLCPSSSPRIASIFQLLHIDLATEPFDAKGYDGFRGSNCCLDGARLD